MPARRAANTRFRCCACGRVFGEHQALCEDWSDPGRSFICPACSTYLVRADVAGIAVIEGRPSALERAARHAPVAALAAAVVAGAFLVEGMAGELAALGTLFLGGLGVAAFALQRGGALPPQETVRAEEADPARRLEALH
jgi:hypothetical protein